MDENLKKEIENRRTFAIISHPDAGKTTLTEKFLLYGGAINTAGSVKGILSMQCLIGWELKKKEVFQLHLQRFSLTMKDIALIFWILRDIRTSQKILIER